MEPENRDVLKRMLARANGSPILISAMDLARERTSTNSSAPFIPPHSIIISSVHDLLIMERNPPDGFAVQRVSLKPLVFKVQKVH